MRYVDEVRRKCIHLSSALIPILYAFMPTWLALSILLPLLGVALALDWARVRFPAVRARVERCFGRLFRSEESRRLSGATYVLVAGVLCIALFPKRVAIAVLLIMSVSDALASLVGRRFGTVRLFGKSIEGSLAHAASACLIGLAALPAAPVAAVLGALCATLVEALPLRLGRHHVDDNLAVPLASGAVITLILSFPLGI